MEWLMRSFFLVLSLLLLAETASAQTVQRCPAQLPAPVAAKRDAIVAAARASDGTALKGLIGPGEFTFSFGDDADAIAYWRDSVKQGIDVPKMMVAVLSMPCVIVLQGDRREYWWPSAAEFAWKDLNAAEKKALQDLYGARIDDWWLEGRDKGYYVGWRAGIDARGAWTAFVAGD
jgi:hypothetical protein